MISLAISLELLLTLIIIAVGIIYFVVAVSMLKKCPADKIMVVYGYGVKSEDGVKGKPYVTHGGVKSVIPFIQSYQFIDLNPYNFEVNIPSTRSKDKQLVSFESSFSVAVSPMQKEIAAERLLGVSREKIEELAKDIIYGQVRLLISQTEADSIDRGIADEFLTILIQKCDQELSMLGLRIINFKLIDIIKK